MMRRVVGTRMLVVAALLATSAVVLPAFDQGATAASGAVTKKVTATRTVIDEDGTSREISHNDVKLTVSQTTSLRGRQELKVSWEGAVPTRALVTNVNSSAGKDQEYPFVLLQCRGVDTTGKVPKGQSRLRPENCWTQTTSERYVSGATATPGWRFDAHAPAADRAALVDTPDPWPEACGTEPQSSRWLHFAAAGGTVYQGGPDPDRGCIGQAPESADTNGGLPSNTTYGITGADGKGRADFAVWSKAENASLGCTADVDCALVAVPIVGLSCDAWGHRLPDGVEQTNKSGTPLTSAQKTAGNTSCSATGKYEPGEGSSVQTTDAAVRGTYWWSESNWRNRLTVPLEFAVTGEVCDAESKTKPVELIGSVAVNELAASWRPKFCTDKSLFNFTHIQQSDSLARRSINQNELPAGFTTAPVGESIVRPVVQAPLTFTGFAIAFTIDDANRERQDSLKLNARLVAKLLSASYPAASFVRNNNPGLQDNPLNISVDPEFQALNPGLLSNSSKESAATLQNLSSNADLVWAMTSWIDADPEARAWLDGAADPWGMKVNPNYRGIELPVENWPLLDEFIAPDASVNPCYRETPSPYLQLVANPTATLNSILVNLQFGLSSVRTGCAYDGNDPTSLSLKLEGAQSVGFRFVLGLVTLSSAERYNLRTAALQTTSTVPAATQFTNADGRTFTAGDASSLKAAAELLKPDGKQWNLDYKALSTARGAKAYPGALPVYATVPTSGLEKPVADKLTRFLCYSVDRGQRPGQANGRLPDGYLSITVANGLGAQRSYVVNAIAAVRQQKGAVPALDDRAGDASQACSPTKAKPVSTPSTAPAADPVVDSPVVEDVPATEDVAVAADDNVAPEVLLTAGQGSMLGDLGMPLLLLAALLAGVVGSVMRWWEPLGATVRRGRGAWAERTRGR